MVIVVFLGLGIALCSRSSASSQLGFLGGNANGFKMKLDAGHDYYFLQNITAAKRTVLSSSPKAIVLLEIGGSSLSEWKRKP